MGWGHICNLLPLSLFSKPTYKNIETNFPIEFYKKELLTSQEQKIIPHKERNK
jgi:hypothetical protein